MSNQDNVVQNDGFENDDVLQAAFAKQMKGLISLPDVTLVLRPAEAWILFSQLQLALRHPSNTGPSSVIARAVAIQIQELLPQGSAMAEVARRGWIRSFDVPADDEAVDANEH